MSWFEHNRDQFVKALGVLRGNLPATVLHGLDNDLIALFALVQVSERKAGAMGVSVPEEVLLTSTDPAATAYAVATLATETSGWADQVRDALELPTDVPIVGIGVVYNTRESTTDPVRIAFCDLDGTGFLLGDGSCAVYPVTAPPDYSDQGRETTVMYLATLILDHLVRGSEPNQRALLRQGHGR